MKIEGNAGTGNTFTEINIAHVENYNPNVKVVENHYYSKSVKKDDCGMRLKHITFTGIDAKTDIRALCDIQNRWPMVEFGVLTSYHWYENGNRYLDPMIIDKLRGYGLNLALHVCGSAAHDAACGNWRQIDKLVWMNLDIFDRVQLNIANRQDNPSCCHIPLVNGKEVIIQQRGIDNLDMYFATLNKWRQPSYKWSMLLDSSGGRGIDTPLKVYESRRKVGYAGGINPDNVGDKLSFLLENVKTGEFWIDMESGVRTDDWFDVDKVVKVMEICENVIKEGGYNGKE